MGLPATLISLADKAATKVVKAVAKEIKTTALLIYENHKVKETEQV